MSVDTLISSTIKVTIITGSTGVGKSSFLIELLQSLPPHANSIVISHRHANSYGLETSICPFTRRVVHYQVFDFGSGCICCSPDGDLTRLLQDFHNKQRSNQLYTHMFLETTGVADVRPFRRCVRRSPSFHLHSVVCLVDSKPSSKLYAARTDPASYHRSIAQLEIANVIVVVPTIATPTSNSVTSTSSTTTIPFHTMTLEQLITLATTGVSSIQQSSSKSETKVSSVEDENLSLRSFLFDHHIHAPIIDGRSRRDQRNIVVWKDIIECMNKPKSTYNTLASHVPDDSCVACNDNVVDEVKVKVDDEDELWRHPSPFTMQHDRTFSSACIEEQGGVMWSKCRPWLEKLLIPSSSSSSSSPCVAARIKGWVTTVVEEETVIGRRKDPELAEFEGEEKLDAVPYSQEWWNRKKRTRLRQKQKSVIFVDGVEGGPLRWWVVTGQNHSSMKSMDMDPGNAELLQKYEDSQSTVLSTYLHNLSAHESEKHYMSSKLFFFGRGLSRAVLEDEFRTLSVLDGFVPVADLLTEFGEEVASKYIKGRGSTIGVEVANDANNEEDLHDLHDLDDVKGVKEATTVVFEVRTTPSISTFTSYDINLKLVLYTDQRRGKHNEDLHLRCMVAETWMDIPMTTVGTKVCVDLKRIETVESALERLVTWYLSGVRITKKEIESFLELDNGSLAIQTMMVDRILRHSVAVKYPVNSKKREGFISDLIKTMWTIWPRKALHDDLLILHQEYAVNNMYTEESRPPSLLVSVETPPSDMEVLEGSYWRSFLVPNHTCKPDDNCDDNDTMKGKQYVHVCCRDTFGGVSGTSIKVWPAGVILGRYLAQQMIKNSKYKDKIMVEFGCGTGITGITLLAAGSPKNYVFTDGAPLAIENVRRNVTLNDGSIARARKGTASIVSYDVLDWVTMRTQLTQRSSGVSEASGASGVSGVSSASSASSASSVSGVSSVSVTYCDVDVLVGADLFYDPDVALTFVKDIVVPMLMNEKTKQRECICATSIRNETSWKKVLTMFEQNNLQWKVMDVHSCPFGTTARVEIGQLCKITKK